VIYLASKLEHTVPLVLREIGFFFERVHVGKLPVLAEREDQQIIQPLGIWGPLAQDNPSAGPRSLAQVMSILLFCRTVMQKRGGG
jgi:hypothetical protein